MKKSHLSPMALNIVVNETNPELLRFQATLEFSRCVLPIRSGQGRRSIKSRKCAVLWLFDKARKDDDHAHVGVAPL